MRASLIAHKMRQLSLRAVRSARRLTGPLPGRPVLINSFPKSGTHLISQIFDRLPDSRDFGYFIVDATSWQFSARDSNKMCAMVNGIMPGELVRGHIRHADQISTILGEKNVATYFVYRDLRDVVVSEVHYLTFMNPWHKLHRYFWRLRHKPDSAIRLAICGLPDGGPTGLYRDIGMRFRDFAGWRHDSNAYPVRFEDMVGAAREHHIKNILGYYFGNTIDSDLLGQRVQKAIEAIDPSRSHTFRTGKTNQWKKVFAEEHRELFKEFAGDLLIGLGYEKNNDW